MRNEIKDLVGTKFREMGRDIDTGLDCWGLVMEVFKRFGMNVPDFIVDTFAYRAINALAWEEIESREWEQVIKPAPGDAPLVVLMRMHPRRITHAGVYVGENEILHTTKYTGAILSRATRLEPRIEGYYRLCLP